MLNYSRTHARPINWPMFLVFGLISAIVASFGIVEGKWIYLGIMVLPVLGYITIVKPFIFPFGIYVLLIPLDSIMVVSGSERGATLTMILGAMTIVVLLLKGMIEGKLRKPNDVTLWWILYISYAFFTVLWAKQPELAYSKMATAMGLVLLYLVCASYKIQHRELKTLQLFILIGGLLASVLTIYFYISSDIHLGEIGRTAIKIGGRRTSLNKLPFDLLIPFSICTYMMIYTTSKRLKALLIVILCSIVMSILLTGSRGGLLGIGVVIITCMLFIKKRISYGVIFIVIAIVIISFIPDFFAERISDSIQDRGANRLDIWIVGWNALLKYLFTGIGFSNFPVAYTEFAYHAPHFIGKAIAAHNIYLGSIVELGILGSTLMFVGISKHYKELNSLDVRGNSAQYMLKSAFWAILITSFFLDTMWYKSFWLLWMIIVMQKNITGQASEVPRGGSWHVWRTAQKGHSGTLSVLPYGQSRHSSTWQATRYSEMD